MTNRSETSARSPGARLQAAYLSEPLAIPGVFNALVARMAEHAGFDAIYLSGAAVSAGVTALPDVGLLSLDEITRQVRLIVAATNVPLIVDADTGFGGPLHVEQAIRQIEASGAAGVQLEDQELPKRCGHLTGKHLIPAGDMVQKLRAATAARVDPDFVIVARVDARSVTGFDDAVIRAQAYAAAGADVVFPEALESVEEFASFARKLDVPLVANMTEFGRSPLLSVGELGAIGYRMILYPVTALRVALRATERALAHIRAEGTQASLVPNMMTRTRLYEILKYSDFEARDRKYFDSVDS